MNLCVSKSGDEMVINCEYIKGYAFKMVAPRGKSACMTGCFALTRDNRAYFDLKKCLSPYDRAS